MGPQGDSFRDQLQDGVADATAAVAVVHGVVLAAPAYQLLYTEVTVIVSVSTHVEV